ncbi:hypothetical protein [Streptomyces sp. bgisy154]|uniref:hypothetical protein n=1 Tax=Streptomyces sp. bgisy154 TaxID=3413794 RepID=UPI003D722880
MSEHPDNTPSSRLADQPAPRPVGTPPAAGPRLTFEELMAQADGRNYEPLADYLDEAARAELGLPAPSKPLVLGKEDVERIRAYFIARPELAGTLPDSVRDLINL